MKRRVIQDSRADFFYFWRLIFGFNSKNIKMSRLFSRCRIPALRADDAPTDNRTEYFYIFQNVLSVRALDV